MANSFGGFTVSSPLSSASHNALYDLASNCIRDYFGPTCQTVFDCLLSRGPSTLAQLLTIIKHECKRDINPERSRLVEDLYPIIRGRSKSRLNVTRESEEKGFIVDASAVRAALIVLLHHSLVRVTFPNKCEDSNKQCLHSVDCVTSTKYRYVVDSEQAIYLQRYPRFVEVARKTFEEEGAAIVEELLVQGRMGTFEVIMGSVTCVGRYLSGELSNEENLALAQKMACTLKSMIEAGYVELVMPIGKFESSQVGKSDELKNDEHHSIFNSAKLGATDLYCDDEDDNSTTLRGRNKYIESGLQSILQVDVYSKIFLPGAVWRINCKMFHASLRAIYLGRLVAERYKQIQFSGDIVSAALKFSASREFAHKFQGIWLSEEKRHKFMGQKTLFTPNEIMGFLPQGLLADLNNKAGGAVASLSSSLTTMAKFNYPAVIIEIEESQGHPEGGKFEVATRQLLSYLKGRIVHEAVKDHYGDVGARICSILEARGYLEGDTVAENAMVPAKDARELLHRLYKANYISILYLQQSKQHNPASAIYLWSIEVERIQFTVLMNVCRALHNFRLRRQHEVQVGKDWIERAKLAHDMDENYSEMDKINYHKFCQGLERVDNACLQLDETIMVMKNFDNL